MPLQDSKVKIKECLCIAQVAQKQYLSNKGGTISGNARQQTAFAYTRAFV